jgi:DNA-binding response OmpR family regulator
MDSIARSATINANVTLFSDKPVLMRAIRDHLRESGFRNIHLLTDSQAVLTAMRGSGSDLVIVDLDVEHDGSIRVMDMIRKDDKFFQVPIIALTGNASKEVVLKAARAGATDVMVKPFPLKQLHERVMVALGRK